MGEGEAGAVEEEAVWGKRMLGGCGGGKGVRDYLAVVDGTWELMGGRVTAVSGVVV